MHWWQKQQTIFLEQLSNFSSYFNVQKLRKKQTKYKIESNTSIKNIPFYNLILVPSKICGIVSFHITWKLRNISVAYISIDIVMPQLNS